MNIIADWIRQKNQKLHFTLIDPDKQKPRHAANIAEEATSFGTDALMLGGSTVNRTNVEETAAMIKDVSDLPMILFPNSANAVTEVADYIFFMSLLNSKRRKLLVGEQAKGVLAIRELGITPISMGYIVVSTSKTPTTVEKIADLDFIREGDYDKLLSYALTAQYYGMSTVYLEAGSGAEKPVPKEMIMHLRQNLNIPIIVGGGIRDPDTAVDKISHGADAIVTGTIAEDNLDKLKAIIDSVKSYSLP